MSEATFTFRVDETLKNEFATAAKARDRTGAQLLRDFMREFVRQQQSAVGHEQVDLDAANVSNQAQETEKNNQSTAEQPVARQHIKASD